MFKATEMQTCVSRLMMPAVHSAVIDGQSDSHGSVEQQVHTEMFGADPYIHGHAQFCCCLADRPSTSLPRSVYLGFGAETCSARFA